MFRGMYTATSGMIAAERSQHALTNNLANAETPGYKQDQKVMRSFPEMLIHRIREQQQPALPGSSAPASPTPVGRINTGVYAQEGIHQFDQGALTQTERNLDLAIVDERLPENPDTGEQGRLFFTVNVAGEEAEEPEVRYTRNGNFSLNAEGTLITAEGFEVLDEDLEPIVLDHDQFQVQSNGTLVTEPEDLEAGEEIQLFLAYTEQPERMISEGQGLFQWVPSAPEEEADVPGFDVPPEDIEALLGADEAEDMEAVAEAIADEEGIGEPVFVGDVEFLNDGEQGSPGFDIHQGALERSNVDPTRTMSDMLNSYRIFEANQRVLQAYDQSMELAANQIGSLG